MRIDLREIGRLKRHGDAKLRQAISELIPQCAIHQTHGVGAFGLQPPLHLVLLGKGTQSSHVACTQGFHMTQDHGCHLVTTGQFNLRQGFACVHASNQGTQRHQHGVHMRWQDGALAHVRHIAAFALMETDQHLALLHHITHRQTGAIAVAPGGALNGAQNRLGFDFSKVPEVVFQCTLLDRNLRRSIHVLHLAATARACVQAKVWTPWCDALRRLAQHFKQGSFFPVVFFAVHIGTHHLEGQGTVYKHHFAVGAVCDALGFQVHRLDGECLIRPLFCCCRLSHQLADRYLAGSTGLP